MMDLRHLQTFKVIAETGSFVQAAEKLAKQPDISSTWYEKPSYQ